MDITPELRASIDEVIGRLEAELLRIDGLIKVEFWDRVNRAGISDPEGLGRVSAEVQANWTHPQRIIRGQIAVLRTACPEPPIHPDERPGRTVSGSEI